MRTFAFRCRQVKPSHASDVGDQVPSYQPQPLTKWKHLDGCFDTGWQSWSLSGERRFVEPTDIVGYQAITMMWDQRYQSIWVAPCDCTLEPQDHEWIKSDPDLREKHPFDSEWHELAFTKEEHSGLWRIGPIGHWTQLPVNCPNVILYEKPPKNLFRNVQDQTPEPPRERCDLFGDLAVVLGLLALWPQNPQYITRVIQDLFYCEGDPLFDSQLKPKAMNRLGKLKFSVLRSLSNSL